MKCVSLRLIRIRSFEDYTLEPAEGLTFLQGPNGSGKTNLAEAMYYASAGRSFRTAFDSEMIRLGEEEGTILLSFSVRGVTHELKLKLSREKGKKLTLNGTPLKRKDLLGLFRTVLFTPSELQLIKGAPVLRRRFLDMEISQVSPRYYETFLRYTRAVAQRNAAFRNALITGKKPDIDLWDMQIAGSAVYLVKKRLETIRKMNQTVPAMEGVLTGNREELEIRYVQHGSEEIRVDEEWFLRKLSEAREEDARYCRTSVGPHRDDLLFLMNGADISRYGSQGQQRTAILAMKLSEAGYIREETGENPVLILDDMGSELDRGRREALLNYLNQKEIQAVITGTETPGSCEGKIVSLQ